MEPETSSSPPAGAWKLSATVSIRAEVHALPDFTGVRLRWPLPSWDRLAAAAVLLSTSPVPKFAVQPAPLYWVPMSFVQLADGAAPAAPVKPSLNTVVQPGGAGGTVVAELLAASGRPMTMDATGVMTATSTATRVRLAGIRRWSLGIL